MKVEINLNYMDTDALVPLFVKLFKHLASKGRLKMKYIAPESKSIVLTLSASDIVWTNTESGYSTNIIALQMQAVGDDET